MFFWDLQVLYNNCTQGLRYTIAIFCIYNTSFIFRRNQNYHDIIKGMSLGNKKLNNVTDLTNQFHHVFFFGDLNYRLFDVDPLVGIAEFCNNKNYVLDLY